MTDHAWTEALDAVAGLTVTFRSLTPHGRALMDALGVNVAYDQAAPKACPDHDVRDVDRAGYQRRWAMARNALGCGEGDDT